MRLIEDLHIPAENIIVSGDSAGGGLSLALMLYLRDNEYPLPAGAILMSPWVGMYSPQLCHPLISYSVVARSHYELQIVGYQPCI